ncbi:MAG: LAGLIDADG family homing endonuclease [archaeon]
MDEQQKYELENLIEELEGYRGRHTELITVLVPAGATLTQTTKQLENEKGTATNIKSTSTRKNVINALERAIRKLKEIGRTPENGLAVFSGNVSQIEGQEDLQVWAIEPPKKLKIKIYRCDQTFVLEPLKEMLENDEIYALMIIERNEATIGMLDGKHIKVLQHMTSGVPGKTRAGGQCLSPDTLLMKDDGEIIEIKDSHNPLIIVSENFNKESSEETPLIAKWENDKQLFEIITKFPRMKIKASKDHTFFVRTRNGIEEKPLEKIKEGDYLLIPEKINIEGKNIIINPIKYYNSFIINEEGRKLLLKKRKEKNLFQREIAEDIGLTQTALSQYEIGKRNIRRSQLQKLCERFEINPESFLEKYTEPYKYQEINLPKELTKDFAKVLGYFLGDGTLEKDRLTFFEQRKELSDYYKNLFDKLFNVATSYKFRESKNYHQLRITSRPLVRLIQNEFSEILGTLNSQFPKKVFLSKNEILASFISGLFDAEGWVSSNRVGIGMHNEKIIRQLQLSLLRFGIISSVLEYDNRKNTYSDNIRYTLTIEDNTSLKKFEELINFNSEEKISKLRNILQNRSNKSNVRQLAVNGKEVARILRNSGLTTEQFNSPLFFVNKRQMSKNIFKEKILDKIENPDLKKRLEKYYLSNLIPVKISKISPLGIEKTVDIETKNHNFIANCLIVHNSAQRFSRIRESMAKEFFKRVAEAMKTHFFENKKIKGILIGGPIPTKDDFLDGGGLVTSLKDKVIAVKDIGGTEMHGLQELVERCQDVLAEQEITKQKVILDQFFEKLAKDPDKVAYGESEVEDRLNRSAVEKLILSKTLPKENIRRLEKLAKESSTEIHLVTNETAQGVQFDNLGGVGGILRFAVMD